ncbi:MAG: 30S ribosomal protein S5 [Candidatus Peregrinibacteria bacterium GW2011_GWA2_44_7]|nr:MAG: 30S ribosomal protein S5 [Candidatus Peregrinibacteria bacterium GW2011_GWA2_44_7]
MSYPNNNNKNNNKRGPRMQEVKEFDEEVIQLDRVTRVVKGGRRMRFRATVAIGNRKGKVGIGIGKSAENLVDASGSGNRNHCRRGNA